MSTWQTVANLSRSGRRTGFVSALKEPPGHVVRVDRARGPVWYAKYRLPDGRQVQKKVGPAWADRGGKPSTVKDYRNVLRSRLLPTFGERPIDSITPADVEYWQHSLEGLSNRSKNKLLTQLHGVFRRAQQVYGLESNPLALVEKHPLRPSGDIEVLSPEGAWSLVRAAASKTDAAIFLTAAFTGLRLGELLALRWGDVDCSGATIRARASYALGALTTPKSGRRTRPTPQRHGTGRESAGPGEHLRSDTSISPSRRTR